MTISPSRYHLEMLRDEIQGHLPVVLRYPDGFTEPMGVWAGFVLMLLRNLGDRPTWSGKPITMIHDATRQPWGGREPAVYVDLGERGDGQ